jgi:hypothetical protein
MHVYIIDCITLHQFAPFKILVHEAFLNKVVCNSVYMVHLKRSKDHTFPHKNPAPYETEKCVTTFPDLKFLQQISL